MTSTSLIRATTRAALLGTTALVVSASGAQAIDYIVNATETSTFILGLGTADTLTINGLGEINSVSPGVAVIDLADFITITDTGAGGPEIDADAVGIEVQGATADLTGGITIASGAIVTAVTTPTGSGGTGILVHSSADIAGGINNSGAITGYDMGVGVGTNASVSGGIVNTGSIFGNSAAIAIGSSPIDSSTMGAITNSGSGVIGVNSTNSSVSDRGIMVAGTGSDITGLITNSATATIVGTAAAIHVALGADISGGITNAGMIGQATTTGGPVTADVGIAVTSSGDISGTITNSGTIVGDTAAILVNSASISGGIVNTGTIAGGTDSGDAAIAVSAGTLGSTANIGIANQTSGVIAGNVAIDISSGAIVHGITNSGTIVGTGAGGAINAENSFFVADITNNTGGLIGVNVGGTTANNTGIFFDNTDSTGGISNNGTIVGGTRGISLTNGSVMTGAITNSTSGAIGSYAAGTHLADTGISIDNSTVTGGIVNSGAIVGTDYGIRLAVLASVGSLTNNAGGVIVATSSGTAVYVEGGSQITGILTNSGTIGNTSTAGGTADRGLLVVGTSSDIIGGVNNSGTIKGANAAIEVQTSAAISGGITNSGAIGHTANSIDGIHVNGGSVGSTSGTGISNTGSGVIAGSHAGILVDTGGSVLGGISNTLSAVITGGTYGLLVSSASVTGGVNNDGKIYGGSTGLAVTGTSSTISGVVDNSGTISGGSTAIYVSGSNAALSSGILNSGTIYAPVVAIDVNSGGDINGITNSGYIGVNTSGSSFANTAILVANSSSDISGTITNTGIIRGDNMAISLISSGRITGGIANGLGGLIQGDGGAAINIALGSIVGSTSGTGISNASSGVIRGTNIAINVLGSVEGGISNSGTIEATSSGAAAIYVSGTAASITGGISNAVGGVIAATSSGDGIQLRSSASLTGGISNSGTISGDHANGISLLSGASLTGDITNAVSTAVIAGESTGILLDNATLTGSIVNSGSITGSDNVGIALLNSSTITGTVTNNTGAVIAGSDYGIRVESGSDIAGGISNAGRISGFSSDATGIYIGSGASVGSITNSGLIEGGSSTGYGIFLTTGATVTAVTNSGTIEGVDGSIQFGSGSETLTLQTGSNLIGGADGGLGTDTLVLTGNGEENEDFTSFENLTVSASSAGTWDLQGTSAIAAVTLNSGTLEISGDFSATSAALAGGSLNVSSGGSFSVGTISGTSGDLDVAGTITATGSVTVGGTLSVTNSGTLNAATVTALGDADVEGLIVATTMTVAGTLSGSGTISGALTVNGILSPGNSPGQLNVVGAFVEGNNSSYLVEHLGGATPETDIVVVTGTATIGTNVDVNVSVGAGTDGFEDDILTATAGITGTYDDVTGLDDNVVGLIAYPDANTATLLVAKTDALAATAATVSDAGFVFLDNLQEGARRDGRVWATGYIYSAENEGLGQDGADYDQDAFGFNAGVDVISQPNLKVGVAVGYIDGDIDIDSSTSDAENDGIFGAAYLNYMNDNFYLDGAIMIGQQTVDTTRTLTAGTATASIDATSYGANLEAGFELEALGGRLSPFVKVGIHSASLDAYSESGAAGAMRVGEVETQQMRVGGGFRYAVDLGSADGIQVTPAIKVGMTQEWQDGDSSADIGFVGYTGSTTAALDFQDQTTVDLGISFDVKLSQAVTAFVGWDAALGDETTRNTGTIGLSVNW